MLTSFNVLDVCLSVVFRGFLSSVASRKDSAMSRAERGELTLSQVGEIIDCHFYLLLLMDTGVLGWASFTPETLFNCVCR